VTAGHHIFLNFLQSVMATACDEYSDGSDTKQRVTLGTELTLVMAGTAIMTVKVKCSVEDLFVTKRKRK